MTLSIPIHQSITLPDRWQACKTPQELSYWLIAKFETFEADVEAAAAAAAEASHEAQTALEAAQAAAADATQALNAISNLDAQVVQLNARVTSLSADLTAAEGNITTLTARITTAETDIANLNGRVDQVEFDIGQAQTDINAVGTIAQNNQREIGTDDTAGTIKGRLTELESTGDKKLYRHMVRVTFSGIEIEWPNGYYNVKGYISGRFFVEALNASNVAIRNIGALSSMLPENGGVIASGVGFAENSVNVGESSTDPMSWNVIFTRARKVQNGTSVTVDWVPLFSAVDRQWGARTEPAEYQYKACESYTNYPSTVIPSGDPVWEVYDVVEEITFA